MTDRIPAHAVEGLTSSILDDFSATPPAAGQVPVWDEALGEYVPGDPVATAATALVPLTTTVGGVPQLVWDADDNLVMTEIPL